MCMRMCVRVSVCGAGLQEREKKGKYGEGITHLISYVYLAL